MIAGIGLLLTAGLIALGVWQLERRAWKHELIARIDARIHAAPVPAPVGPVTAEDAEYLRVQATGLFDHNAETLVQAVTARGGGYWVLTPLRTPDFTVLVNRGFVPTESRDPVTRMAGQVEGEVTITGLLRVTEPDGGFLRDNDPAADRWYSRDVAAIATARGVSVVPYFIDADATPNPGGLPVGGLTVVSFRDNHMSYALTWFALAAGMLACTVLVIRHDRRPAA